MADKWHSAFADQRSSFASYTTNPSARFIFLGISILYQIGVENEVQNQLTAISRWFLADPFKLFLSGSLVLLPAAEHFRGFPFCSWVLVQKKNVQTAAVASHLHIV